MSTPHTPGPWTVSQGDTWLSVGPPIDSEPLIADVIGWREDDGLPPPRSYDECLANARVMSASPQLLEAAEYVVNMLSQSFPTVTAGKLDGGEESLALRLAGVGGVRALALAEAAVAKAKGGAA